MTRYLLRSALALAFTLLLSSQGFTQGGRASSFSGGSGGSSSFSGGGSSFSGGGGGSSSSSSSTGSFSGSNGAAVSGTNVMSATNFLSSTYANPMYQGRPGAPESNNNPGGFGQASFGSTTGGATRGATTGSGFSGGTNAMSRSGSTSSFGGGSGTSFGGGSGTSFSGGGSGSTFGGGGTSFTGGSGASLGGGTSFGGGGTSLGGGASRTGTGIGGGASRTGTGIGGGAGATGRTGTGIGGNAMNSNASMVDRVTYPATFVNPPRPMPMIQVQSNLRGIIDRSSALTRSANIRIEMDGRVVVLRGKAASPDERRLAEGLIRLSPGVGAVRNELEVE